MSERATKRARCGETDEIYAVYKEEVLSAERYAYTEDLDGPLDINEINKRRPVLKKLRFSIAPNGSMVQSASATALRRLATEKEEEWHLSTEAPAWASSQSKKIRAMCRHVQQAILKLNGADAPEWLEPYMAEGEGETKKASSAGACMGKPQCAKIAKRGGGTDSDYTLLTESDYTFAYDGIKQTMTRIRVGAPAKTPAEYCTKIWAPPGSLPSDEPQAIWPDGMTRTVPGSTCAEWGGGVAETKLRVIFTGVMKDGQKTVVRESVRLGVTSLILWADDTDSGRQKQIMQLNATTPEAEAFMKQIAKDYTDGKATKIDVESAKRRFLSAQKKVQKKPAAPKPKAKQAPREASGDEAEASEDEASSSSASSSEEEDSGE